MFPFALNENEILAFALVLIRISTFLVSWPLFSIFMVPGPLKVLFAVLLATLMFPTIDRQALLGTDLGNEIIWLGAKEAALGVGLGFITRMFFFVFSVAGSLISTFIGLSSAHVFNPAIGAQTTTVEQFYLGVAALIFLALNGHHIFLEGLSRSFELIPLSMNGVNFEALQLSTKFVHEVVVAGLQISAPVMVTIFLMNVFMGILGRTVPQINVLVTSLPVNILVGLVVMIVSLPILIPEIEVVMRSMSEQLFMLMKEL